MSVAVTIAVVIVLGLWAAAIYSRLVRLKNQVRHDWGQLERQLKRRHALSASLVAQVKGSASIDQGLVDAVVAAHEQAARVRGPVDAAAAEAALTEAIRRVLPSVGRDPAITARLHVRDLTAPLEAVEFEIGAAGAAYNTTAAAYNAAIQILPNNIIAGFGSFPKAERFQPARAAATTASGST
jgi:LemA protein